MVDTYNFEFDNTNDNTNEFSKYLKRGFNRPAPSGLHQSNTSHHFPQGRQNTYIDVLCSSPSGEGVRYVTIQTTRPSAARFSSGLQDALSAVNAKETTPSTTE